MKQIITLLVLVFAISTQAFAVKSALVVENQESTVQLDYQKKDGFLANAKHFVAKKVSAVKNIANKLGMVEKVLLIVLAFVLPPLAVWFAEGEQWTSACTINLILTLLCGVPGVIHALIVVLR